MSRAPDTDVLVAGGGPVGLAAAIAARGWGLDVVVLEQRATPVDKACGEGLMPSALRSLRVLGVDPPGAALEGIRYVDGLRSVETRFRRGPGRGVRRTVLHEYLRKAAVDAGVVVASGRVAGLRQDGASVEAVGLRARWLLAADGLHSHIRHELGVAVPQPAGRSARFGQRRHYAVAPWTDLVEVHWSPRAEAYVTPVAPDLVGVAVLGPAGLPYARALDYFPALQARLGGAAAVTPVRGAGPMRQRSSAVRVGRVLLVGDAAGYVDALTGEGIAVGIASAQAAAAAVAGGRPETYDQAWRRLSRRYRVITSGLLIATSRSDLRAALVPTAARLPGTFGRVVEAIA